MHPPAACERCGNEFSVMRIAGAWPTRIDCRHCRARHGYRFGTVIGIAYAAVLIPSSVAVTLASSRFADIENGIHSAGWTQYGVQLTGLLIVYLVVGSIYGSLMKRWAVLRPRAP